MGDAAFVAHYSVQQVQQSSCRSDDRICEPTMTRRPTRSEVQMGYQRHNDGTVTPVQHTTSSHPPLIGLGACAVVTGPLCHADSMEPRSLGRRYAGKTVGIFCASLAVTSSHFYCC